jgi:hypothetical protein
MPQIDYHQDLGSIDERRAAREFNESLERYFHHFSFLCQSYLEGRSLPSPEWCYHRSQSLYSCKGFFWLETPPVCQGWCRDH